MKPGKSQWRANRQACLPVSPDGPLTGGIWLGKKGGFCPAALHVANNPRLASSGGSCRTTAGHKTISWVARGLAQGCPQDAGWQQVIYPVPCTSHRAPTARRTCCCHCCA